MVKDYLNNNADLLKNSIDVPIVDTNCSNETDDEKDINYSTQANNTDNDLIKSNDDLIKSNDDLIKSSEIDDIDTKENVVDSDDDIIESKENIDSNDDIIESKENIDSNDDIIKSKENVIGRSIICEGEEIGDIEELIDIDRNNIIDILKEFKMDDKELSRCHKKFANDMYKRSIRGLLGYWIRLGIVLLMSVGCILWALKTKNIFSKQVLILMGLMIFMICTGNDIVMKYDIKNVFWFHKKKIDYLFLVPVTNKIIFRESHKRALVLNWDYCLYVDDISEYSSVSLNEIVMIMMTDGVIHVASTEQVLGMPKANRSFKDSLR